VFYRAVALLVDLKYNRPEVGQPPILPREFRNHHRKNLNQIAQDANDTASQIGPKNTQYTSLVDQPKDLSELLDFSDIAQKNIKGTTKNNTSTGI
jgi:hypothetical protein